MANYDLIARLLAKDHTGPGTKSARQNFDKVNDSTNTLSGSLANLGKSAATNIAQVAKYGAIAGAAVTVAFGAKSLKAASDFNESVNAVNVSFGEAADGIMDLSKNSAVAVGLSSRAFNGLAVQFSGFTKTIAGDGGDVVGVMRDLTGRAADFASVMNLDVAEAARLFQSGLAGETEPLRRYGIDLSAAAVEAHAMAVGIGDGTGQLTEQEKVMARYSLLMQSTSQVQGDFANTSDGMANQTRILSSSFEDLQSKVGQALIPLAEAVLPRLNEGLSSMIATLDQNMPQIEETARGWGQALAGAIDRLEAAWPDIKRNVEDTATTLKAEWPGIKDTFENVGAAIGRVTDFAGKMWDAFRSLPPEVQQVLALLAVAQKTGVINVAFKGAELVKGLVSRITAAAVYVTGPVAGGKGGTIGKVGAAGAGAGTVAGRTALGLIGGASGGVVAGATAGAIGAARGSAMAGEQGANRGFVAGAPVPGAGGMWVEQTVAEAEQSYYKAKSRAGWMPSWLYEFVYQERKPPKIEPSFEAREALQKLNTSLSSVGTSGRDAAQRTEDLNRALGGNVSRSEAYESQRLLNRALTDSEASAREARNRTDELNKSLGINSTASTDAEGKVKAFTGSVLGIPSAANLPQLRDAINNAGVSAGLTDEQLQHMKTSVERVPDGASIPQLRDAIEKAGGAAGLTDEQIAGVTAAALAVPANASVPQLKDAIEKAGRAAGLTDTQIQGVTAAALAVPRDTPANITTNATTAKGEVDLLQSTIRGLEGKQVNVSLAFVDGRYSDARGSYYGVGGGQGAGASEPDMETFVTRAIERAVPSMFTGGGTGAWRKPAGQYSVSSEWMRGGTGIHYGIDLAGPMGTPIFAAAGGRVSQVVFSNTGYGNMVRMDHGGGVSTLYAHLAGINVRQGAVLPPGAVLGAMGSTGDSTGPHLHFETRVNGAPVEPRAFMMQRGVLFDKGGWLDPGFTLVRNESGKPEPVLTNAEWRVLKDAVGAGGMAAQPAPVQVVIDGRVLHESLVRYKREQGGAALGLA